MSAYRYAAGYSPASPEGAQFFALVRAVFGLSLSPIAALDWPAMGYRCHSLLDGAEMAANVSALRMTLQVMGRPTPAVQLGAVAVTPEHRGHGLARQLMERVLAEYADTALMILFPNETVLDFYPKFGFRAVPQYTAVCELPPGSTVPQPPRLAPDSPEAQYILSQPQAASSILDARGNPLALWANLRLVCPDGLYSAGEGRALLAQQQGDTLHIFDVFSPEPFDILPWVAWPGVHRLHLHFTPDWLGLPYTWQPDPDETLFVRGPLPEMPAFCFPATGKT